MSLLDVFRRSPAPPPAPSPLTPRQAAVREALDSLEPQGLQVSGQLPDGTWGQWSVTADEAFERLKTEADEDRFESGVGVGGTWCGSADGLLAVEYLRSGRDLGVEDRTTVDTLAELYRQGLRLGFLGDAPFPDAASAYSSYDTTGGHYYLSRGNDVGLSMWNQPVLEDPKGLIAQVDELAAVRARWCGGMGRDAVVNASYETYPPQAPFTFEALTECYTRIWRAMGSPYTTGGNDTVDFALQAVREGAGDDAALRRRTEIALPWLRAHAGEYHDSRALAPVLEANVLAEDPLAEEAWESLRTRIESARKDGRWTGEGHWDTPTLTRTLFEAAGEAAASPEERRLICARLAEGLDPSQLDGLDAQRAGRMVADLLPALREVPVPAAPGEAKTIEMSRDSVVVGEVELDRR